MPEGHSVHRIARQFDANFVGKAAEITSPQGRFSDGAALLNGVPMMAATAVGKQLFLGFANELWLRVHLGIYGAWDFAGEVLVHPSIQVHGIAPKLGQDGQLAVAGNAVKSAAGRALLAGHGSNNRARLAAEQKAVDAAAEDSVTSIGAPRKTRVRMAEQEKGGLVNTELWPPEPVGQVRARLLTDTVCADLRGPTACEVITAEQKEAVLQRLGPDPANDASPAERDRFVQRAATKKTPIGLVLMDQAVIAGIGNVYRAEMLFRARLDPHRPANELSREQLVQLWNDWVKLLGIGIHVGQMITVDGLTGEAYQRTLVERDARHWVYKKEGTACARCGASIVLEEFGARKLYWCPGCQK